MIGVRSADGSDSGPALRPSHGRRGLLLGGLGAVLVLVMSALLMISASRPRVTTLRIDESDPTQTVLVIEGEHLNRLRGQWADEWTRSLLAAGVQLEVAELPRAERDEPLRVPVTLSADFDADTLPGPQLLTEAAPVPVEYRLRLAVAYVDYAAKRETEGARRLFTELLDFIPASERVSFVPEVDFHVLVPSPDQPIEDFERFDELEHADLVTSGAYMFIRVAQGLRRVRSEDVVADPRDPLSILACSVRASDDYTYASAIVTPADGALARALDQGGTRARPRRLGFHTPGEVLDALDALPEGQTLQWFIPSKSSTSGYLMPCLEWREVIDSPRVTLIAKTPEHHNNLPAAKRAADASEDAWVVASIYESLLFDDDVEREAWRTLWVKGGIPHGGVYVSNTMLPRKRRLLREAMGALIDDYQRRRAPFPDFGWGISGLRRCPPNFDEFEQRILTSENVGHCAPELAP